MSANTFTILYITTYVVMGIIVFLSIFLGAVLFMRAQKKEEEQADFYTRIAIRQQQKAERLAQEETELKKKNIGEGSEGIAEA